MANCNYKVKITDIQNKYKFKIFCVGGGGNLNDYYTKTEVNTLLGNKQDTLTFDTTPTENSTNPVTSGGLYIVLGNISSALDTINGEVI